MKFAERIRRIREDRAMDQKTLASKTGYSDTLISRIESGHELPGEEAAKKIFDALNVDRGTRLKLKGVLKKERQAKIKPSEQKYIDEFAKALSEILADLGMNATEFSEHTKRTYVTASYWLSGRLLPGGESLENEVVKFFRYKGVSERNIRRLKRAHLRTQIAKLLRLEYLDEKDKELIQGFINRTRKEKPTGEQRQREENKSKRS